MRKVFISVLLLTAAMLLPLTACSNDSEKKPAAADLEAGKQPVQAFGVVKALETIEVTAPFAADLTEINVKEGQLLTLDSLLAEYDDREARMQLKLMEEELKAANLKTGARRKMLDEKKVRLNNGTDPELLKLEKSLEAARMKQLAADDDAARLMELKNSGTATEKELRDSSLVADINRSTAQELQLTLESLKISKLKDIQQESLQLDQELSEIKLLELKINFTKEKMDSDLFKDHKVHSPVSNGAVEQIICRQGTPIPEKSVLFRIINMDTLIIEANVDERFIKDVGLGAKAYITPEWDRSLEYKGKVTFISSLAVLQNGETVVAVQITPDDKDIRLLPGSNAEIDIIAQ